MSSPSPSPPPPKCITYPAGHIPQDVVDVYLLNNASNLHYAGDQICGPGQASDNNAGLSF